MRRTNLAASQARGRLVAARLAMQWVAGPPAWPTILAAAEGAKVREARKNAALAEQIQKVAGARNRLDLLLVG